MATRPKALGGAAVRWLVAAGLIVAIAQLPDSTSEAAQSVKGWPVPTAPDLSRCDLDLGRQLRKCRTLLNEYGQTVAERAAQARAREGLLPRSSRAAAVKDKCARSAFEGAVCGHVDVPLDRSDPGLGTIPIAFELYEHTSSGPAESVIVVNFGGPGPATIPNRGGAFFLFARNLKNHDLLLIDDRGRGRSGVIKCPRLQGSVGTIFEQVAECADILGPAADRYGSGDIALDVEEVRAALGYELIDYYGVSYGGADVSAYATRFPHHIRSLILDAPWGDTPIRQEFVSANLFVRSTLDVLRLMCERSHTCRAERPDPAADFSYLVEHVRQAPVVGRGYDAFGEPVDLDIDPQFVIEYLMLGPFIKLGELAAAGVALREGDSAPLRRLAAEAYYPICCLEEPSPFAPPPRIHSLGAFVATYCVDNEWNWNWSSPIPEREAQHAAALASAPPEMFFPFTASEATDSTFIASPGCILWPEPDDPSPIAPPGAVYPSVPTFVLGGDLDNVVPLQQARWVADLFPDSELVEIVSAGHGAAFTPCGARLVSRFVERLELGDTSCAGKPQGVFPAVGEFPKRAQEATPAEVDPGAGNEANEAQRRVAAVAAATVKDAIARAQLAFFGPGRVVTRALRGGRLIFLFDGRDGSNWTIKLRNARFAKNVVVDGSVHLPATRPSVDAKIDISGAANGKLSVQTKAYLIQTMFKVRGLLDGRRVAVRVPQA